MKYTALIGKPTEHSVSHIMFKEMAKKLGLGGDYAHLKIDVDRSNLQAALSAAQTLGFSGLNVTLPYKLDVIQYLDHLDQSAQKLGAVNTITFSNKIVGHNTDWQGIVGPVKRFSDINLRQAAIFGTGGAARAAIYACHRLNIPSIYVHFRNESTQNANSISENEAATLGIKLLGYSNLATSIPQADLIINATSAGMAGNDPAPFLLAELDKFILSQKIFLDAVFNPLNTPLLNYFKSHQSTVIDGLWMMLYQGVEALSLWLGEDLEFRQSELDNIHEILVKELSHE